MSVPLAQALQGVNDDDAIVKILQVTKRDRMCSSVLGVAVAATPIPAPRALFEKQLTRFFLFCRSASCKRATRRPLHTSKRFPQIGLMPFAGSWWHLWKASASVNARRRPAQCSPPRRQGWVAALSLLASNRQLRPLPPPLLQPQRLHRHFGPSSNRSRRKSKWSSCRKKRSELIRLRSAKPKVTCWRKINLFLQV